MLEAIFYARFHPERGPSVIHQYPTNSLLASRSPNDEALINFSDISSYVIPPYEVCNRAASICTNGYRVLGFPVSVEDAKYSRNRFTFNVCFVLDEDGDTRPWEPAVRKTASFFRSIEEEDGILQAEELLEGLKWAGEDGYPASGVGVVHSLLESTMEGLNSYAESSVRLSDLHVLNLRLVAPKPAPPRVRAWDVPLMIRTLPSPNESTWDLTMQRIHPHIDGAKHVQRIAEVADVELRLVKKAIRELLFYGCAMILDIFHFQAIYTLSDDFAWFVKDTKMREECCAYVAIDPKQNIFKETKMAATSLPDVETVIQLYLALGPGLNLQEFCLAHEAELTNIDVRRFVTFGVIKGFVRRIHKYVLAIDSQPDSPQPKLSNGSIPQRAKSSEQLVEMAWKKATLSSGWPTPPTETFMEGLSDASVAGEEQSEEDGRLREFLNGKHCMDEICVALRMTEKKVLEKLRSVKYGEVVLLCK